MRAMLANAVLLTALCLPTAAWAADLTRVPPETTSSVDPASAATPVEDPNDPKTMASLALPFRVPSWSTLGLAAGALLIGIGVGFAVQQRASDRR